jgi:serine protease
MFRAISVCLLLSVLATPAISAASTLHVPADYPTIQLAINAATHGDTVLVAPGVYVELIDFNGKNITVASESGPDVTIIDGAFSGSVVSFKSGETRAATLSDFTVRNGQTSFSGAGVHIANASPTIRGNIITGNRGCTGVGVYSSFGSPRIEGNSITSNVTWGCTGGWGLGIYIGGNSAAEVIGNVITDNRGTDAFGGGVALFAAGNASVIGNIIARNGLAPEGPGCVWGGGMITANFVQATIVNNLIVENVACTAGAFEWGGTTGINVFANNTIANNQASSYPGIYSSGIDTRHQIYNNIVTAQNGPAWHCQNSLSTPSPVVRSSNVFSAQGSAYGGTCTEQTGLNGNISADPGFVSPSAGDYRVASGSPGIDAGSDSAPAIQATDLAGNPRIAGAHIDMGAYESLNHAPTADAGADQTLVADVNCRATVTLNGSGSDLDGDALTFVWTTAAGTFTGHTLQLALPTGTHVITLTVTDGNGGSASDSVVVTVRDETAPTIASVSATPNVLPTPNHEFVPITVAVSATDGCSSGMRCRIVSVTSNEPVAGLWRGDVGPDWEITGDLTVNLRSERSPKGNGRVYTITVECTDSSGNSTMSSVTVLVPRR